MDGECSVATIRRRHQAKAALALVDRKCFVFVVGRNALTLRKNPDLKEVHRCLIRRIRLTVHYAGAGTHALHLAGPDHRPRSHVVAMCELTVEDIRDDLHVAMTM